MIRKVYKGDPRQIKPCITKYSQLHKKQIDVFETSHSFCEKKISVAVSSFSEFQKRGKNTVSVVNGDALDIKNYPQNQNL